MGRSRVPACAAVALSGVWRRVWQCLAVRWGEIEYAKAGDHHIAFREVVGDDGHLDPEAGSGDGRAEKYRLLIL